MHLTWFILLEFIVFNSTTVSWQMVLSSCTEWGQSGEHCQPWHSQALASIMVSEMPWKRNKITCQPILSHIFTKEIQNKPHGCQPCGLFWISLVKICDIFADRKMDQFPSINLLVPSHYLNLEWPSTLPYAYDTRWRWLNTLRLRKNCRHFADNIFKCIFLNENVWISLKISLKFIPEVWNNNIQSLVQIMALRRPGDKPLSEPMIDYQHIYASLGLNELK